MNKTAAVENLQDAAQPSQILLDAIRSTAAFGDLKSFAADEIGALLAGVDLSAFDFRVNGYCLTAHISHLSVFLNARIDRARKVRQEVEIRFSFHSHHGCRAEISPNFGTSSVHIPIYKSFPLDADNLQKSLGWLDGEKRGLIIDGAEKSDYFGDGVNSVGSTIKF